MGGKTVIQQPQTPAPPTAGQNMADYVAGLPKMYEAQMQWNPKLAEQEYQLAQQYTPAYSQLMQKTNEELYPGLKTLGDSLTQQATAGINSAVPSSLRESYLNELRANLGENAGSGIAADYISRNMLNQAEDYKRYYQNMGMSLIGRQPLTQAQVPNMPNVGEGYNYGQVANNNMQGYGSYVSAYGNMYGANANMAAQRSQNRYGLLGTGFGGFSALFPGGL